MKFKIGDCFMVNSKEYVAVYEVFTLKKHHRHDNSYEIKGAINPLAHKYNYDYDRANSVKVTTDYLIQDCDKIELTILERIIYECD